MDLSAFDSARPLVLVGAGKMGGAMLSGWLDRGLPPAAVRVVDPSPPADTAALLARHGLAAVAAVAAGTIAGALILAVKPQMMMPTLGALGPLVDDRTVVVSIAAGIPLAKLRAGLGRGKVVRSMPNTPAQIGQGITVAVAGPEVDAAARDLATALLAAAGAVAWIDDEGLIDAVTAVSGSGPAYVFLLAECMAAAGVAAGLPADLARRLADATVAGSGALLGATGEDPAILRQNVTSRGGTTAAALAVLMAGDGLAPLMQRAVEAAKQRAIELAG